MSGPIIETIDLRREYGEGNARVGALSGVSIQIEPGEIVALRGASGSGKTTLLNIIGCLDRPTSGIYRLGGRDVSTLTREEQAWVRLHFIGFIFQSFYLIPDATALENVALPLYYAGVSRAEREERARKMLIRVGLGERLHHRPNQLSGGQRQRVSIARACVSESRLMLADEPTGALDSRSGREVLDLLRELHQEQQLTILLVTHDAHVAKFAHRQIFMRDGKLVTEQEAQIGTAGA